MTNSMGVRGVRRQPLLYALSLACLVVLAAGVLTACERASQAEIATHPSGATRQLALADEPTTTGVPPTTAPPEEPSTTTTTQPPPGLGVGSEGPAVLALEQKLASLHYYVGQVDEGYDGDTRDAVLAFQKVAGMERTGRATDDVVARLMATGASPGPMVPAGGATHVEVDLEKQVLFLYEGNQLSTILNVSTGSNERFCSEGWCRTAVTPPGSFTVFQKDSGWETGPLGSLYNAQYFNGAIAIHGSPSVPAYPASHGCVRISMSAAEWFPDHLAYGTPVYVLDADHPTATPIVPNAPPVSTPTTIVPEPAKPAPTSTTSTTTNLLNSLLTPPTTRKP
jgi:lipoprotein-anchoring transpeptidase ErfK/SrfK